MGLDVLLTCDREKAIKGDPNYTFERTSLSRTFCSLLMRIHTFEDGEPELNQIGKLTGVNVAIFYKMMENPEETLEYKLPNAKTDHERAVILQEADEQEKQLANNLIPVKETLKVLIKNLQSVPNLPDLLKPPKFDRLNNPIYFSNFNKNLGDGYIGNNFGQDLRNFDNYLDIALENNATSVWFSMG